jgi:general secretion pathway protein A
MYEGYYNLQAEPFRLSPDHRFCFDHRGYAKARAYMAYAFSQAEGFVMITGQPGTGKTTLIGELVESLAGDNVTTAKLVSTQLQADDLLRMVAHSFGLEQLHDDKSDLLQHLAELFEQWQRSGRRALLIVDEAQDLSPQAMEELRLLTNIQGNDKPLLQIFLLGQPELRDMIHAPAMEQLHQRIVAASHLEPLKADETEAYIKHRLDKVGWAGDPELSRAIFPLIHKFSDGIPRRINLICSRLFLHGSVEQKHQLGVQDLKEVIQELHSEQLAAGSFISSADFTVEDIFDDMHRPAVPVETDITPEQTPSEEQTAAAAEPAPEVRPAPVAARPKLETRQVPHPTTGGSHRTEHTKRRGWLRLAVAFNLGLLIVLGVIFKPSDILSSDQLEKLKAFWPSRPAEAITETDRSPAPADSLDTLEQVAPPGIEIEPETAKPVEALEELEVISKKYKVIYPQEVPHKPILPSKPDSTPVPAPAVSQQSMALVEFAFDSTELSADTQSRLAALANSLAGSEQTLFVTGYSDSRGDPVYNLRLSRKRADVVAGYLADKGIAGDRLVVEGLGVYDEASTGQPRQIESEFAATITSQRLVQIVFDR